MEAAIGHGGIDSIPVILEEGHAIAIGRTVLSAGGEEPAKVEVFPGIGDAVGVGIDPHGDVIRLHFSVEIVEIDPAAIG